MTYRFRDKKPIRRVIETPKASYKSYRTELIEDFFDRCGYCNNPRFETMENFHIDHFAPRQKFQDTEWESLLDLYSNLVYSCPHCNILKSNKWVTKNFHLPNDGESGFVCPCSEEYENLFIRNKSGEILPQNSVANYIYDELKLYLGRFSLIWKMDKLGKQIRQLNELNDETYKIQIGELSFEYFKILEEFKRAKGFKRF